MNENRANSIAAGKLYVFEGTDGSGKTRLSTAFADYLCSAGVICEHFAFPGNEDGTLGKHIHRLHHESSAIGIEYIGPTSLQLLHVAAHIDTIDRRILPALNKGNTVVLDRFWWSTWVYGVASGANRKSLRSMIKLECSHWAGIKPTAVFLVHRSIPAADRATLDYHLLEKEYVSLSILERQKYPVVNVENNGDATESLAEIIRNTSLSSELAHA